jgi:hypothetical protein
MIARFLLRPYNWPMQYRWMIPDEIELRVNPICASRGWAQFNINDPMPTCRILGAFDETENDQLVGFFGISLFPVLGPMFVLPDRRDGEASRELAGQMYAFLNDNDARGYLVIADSPVTERLCKRYGMEKVSSPVYKAKTAVAAEENLQEVN